MSSVCLESSQNMKCDLMKFQTLFLYEVYVTVRGLLQQRQSSTDRGES